jgi:hypothetical protein
MLLENVRNWFNAKIKHVTTELRIGREEWEAKYPLEPISVATESGRGETIEPESPPCTHPLTAQMSGFTRCQQCGAQWGSNQPTNGVSRKDYLDGSWNGRKARMNSSAFQESLARLIFRAPKQ